MTRTPAPPAGVELALASQPSNNRALTIATATGRHSVPVYSVRNPGDHELAARALAAGKVAAFYVGLYGIGKAVRPAWTWHDDAETYWRIKEGRPR